MAIQYTSNGSVICTGNADPARTATYAGPRNGTTQLAAISAFFTGDPIAGVDNSPDALRAAIPLPASTTPLAVADAGSLGGVQKYALADHVHASKARKQIITMGAASATFTWTYPTAFGAGVAPICNAIVQVPAGTTDVYNVQVMGVPTNTSCVFQIGRISAGLFGLLTGALGINTSTAVTLHMTALEP